MMHLYSIKLFVYFSMYVRTCCWQCGIIPVLYTLLCVWQFNGDLVYVEKNLQEQYSILSFTKHCVKDVHISTCVHSIMIVPCISVYYSSCAVNLAYLTAERTLFSDCTLLCVITTCLLQMNLPSCSSFEFNIYLTLLCYILLLFYSILFYLIPHSYCMPLILCLCVHTYSLQYFICFIQLTVD